MRYQRHYQRQVVQEGRDRIAARGLVTSYQASTSLRAPGNFLGKTAIDITEASANQYKGAQGIAAPKRTQGQLHGVPHPMTGEILITHNAHDTGEAP